MVGALKNHQSAVVVGGGGGRVVFGSDSISISISGLFVVVVFGGKVVVGLVFGRVVGVGATFVGCAPKSCNN